MAFIYCGFHILWLSHTFKSTAQRQREIWLNFTTSEQAGQNTITHALWYKLRAFMSAQCGSAQFERWYFFIALGFFLVATGILIVAEIAFVPLTWWRWVAIAILSWWLPGCLILWRWSPPELDWPTALILASAVGWCWQIALLVPLHWLPGPLSYPLLVGTYAVGALILLVLCRKQPLKFRNVRKRTWGWLLLLLLIGVLLRLPVLGAHEFHQDETHLLRRANEAIQGSDEALARHTKGIGEIAVIMVTYRALHTINEATARLPFALASVGSIVALGLLGWRLFGNGVGFAAGLLFALNGFALGLSRIAQYQGAVLLLSVAALIAMWEFSRQGHRRWLALALLLSAFGVVMHYEFLFNAFPLAFLFVIGWRHAKSPSLLLPTLLWAGGVGAVVVAGTYVPLLLNPYFATTRTYLSSRLADMQANNWTFFVEITTLYNSIYFALGLLLLVALGTVIGWREYRQQAYLPLLWALPAALVYLLIVQYPGTHFYFIMAGCSLLAALALVWLDNTIRRRNFVAYWGWHGGLLLWFTLSIFYLYLLFFRQSPAYLINYAESRLPLYWAPYGEKIPQQPRFGFPIREGWKALGILAEWQYLGKTYASNERSDMLRWYLRSYDRVAPTENPDFIFVADHVQERDFTFDDDLLDDGPYQRIGEVQVAGEPRIVIWAHAPLAGGYVTYDLDLFEDAFDQDAPALVEWMRMPTTVLHETLDAAVTLQGATRNCARLEAGSILHLALWWRVEEALHVDYKLFVHVADADGRPVAQWDGLPGQNTQQTTLWPPGTVFKDNVLIQLPEDMPAGNYLILVGFYNPVTGNRLGDEAIETMTIRVRT